MKEWQLSGSAIEHIKSTSGSSNLIDVSTDMIVADSTRKFFLENDSGKAQSFLLAAKVEHGDIVGVAAKNACKLYDQLPQNLAKNILKPIYTGEIDGFSYAIYELCQPLTSGKIQAKIQNTGVFDKVVSWHQQVTKATLKPIESDFKSRILPQMNELVACFDQQPEIQAKISNSVQSLNSNSHSPLKTSVAHTDLWRGNIMWSTTGEKDFRVIDWAGMSLLNNPFFDLSRLIVSFRPRQNRAKASVLTYKEIMGCDSNEVMTYFYMSMSDLLHNLDNFPVERFREMVINCDSALEKVLT